MERRDTSRGYSLPKGSPRKTKSSMNAGQSPRECQIYCVPRVAEPIGITGELQYLYSRAKRFLKRRVNYFRKRFAAIGHQDSAVDRPSIGPREAGSHFLAGDLVQIRPAEAIRATLNDWNMLRGCTFVEEMWPYCGTTQRVMKRVERFLDERDYHIKKSSGVVVLEGLICSGSADFGKCDRCCYFFWREEWLDKLDTQTAVG